MASWFDELFPPLPEDEIQFGRGDGYSDDSDSDTSVFDSDHQASGEDLVSPSARVGARPHVALPVTIPR